MRSDKCLGFWPHLLQSLNSGANDSDAEASPQPHQLLAHINMQVEVGKSERMVPWASSGLCLFLGIPQVWLGSP